MKRRERIQWAGISRKHIPYNISVELVRCFILCNFSVSLWFRWTLIRPVNFQWSWWKVRGRNHSGFVNKFPFPVPVNHESIPFRTSYHLVLRSVQLEISFSRGGRKRIYAKRNLFPAPWLSFLPFSYLTFLHIRGVSFLKFKSEPTASLLKAG